MPYDYLFKLSAILNFNNDLIYLILRNRSFFYDMKIDIARKKIKKYLNDSRDDLVKLTQDLCSISTENPPGRNFKPLTEFLADQMKQTGFKTDIIHVPKQYHQIITPRETWGFPRYNLLARWDVGASKTLHYNSHYDVVPVTDDWKTDPFNPVVKRGRLYGRGTSDMKGCIASCIYAFKALREFGLIPSWNIEISFTCDEEIGGMCGAGFLVKENIVRPDAAVICEGGADESIMIGHRGVLWLDILIKGVAAHGSNPDAGVNAFEKGFDLVERIREHHRQCQSRETSFTMDRSNARRPSLTIGGVSGGGTKVNTIPSDFHFTLDRRLIPEEDVKALVSDYKNIIADAKQCDKQLKAKMNVLMDFDAAITDPEAGICHTTQNAVQYVTGKTPRACVFGAFTDLHFFTNNAGCPSIGYGVAGDGIHGCQEYAKISSLSDTARVYADIALNMDK